MKRIINITIVVGLLFLVLLQQVQIDHLRTRIDQQVEDIIQFQKSMVSFMQKTNGSIENLSDASIMNSKAIVKLAGH